MVFKLALARTIVMVYNVYGYSPREIRTLGLLVASPPYGKSKPSALVHYAIGLAIDVWVSH